MGHVRRRISRVCSILIVLFSLCNRSCPSLTDIALYFDLIAINIRPSLATRRLLVYLRHGSRIGDLDRKDIGPLLSRRRSKLYSVPPLLDDQDSLTDSTFCSTEYHDCVVPSIFTGDRSVSRSHVPRLDYIMLRPSVLYSMFVFPGNIIQLYSW